MPSENLYKKYSQRSYDMEGCRDTSFRVVGFGQCSLNSLVFMMSDVMHFMYESYLLSPYATCVWPGGYFDNKEFALFCSVLF